MSKSCSSCKHWHRQPGAPVALVGQPAKGECREGPPGVTNLPMNDAQGRQVGVMRITSYPEPLESMPACSRHAIREEPVNQA